MKLSIYEIYETNWRSMMRTLTKLLHAKSWITRRFLQLIIIGLLGSFLIFFLSDYQSFLLFVFPRSHKDYRKRPECICTRPALPSFPILSQLEIDKDRSVLCSEYATRRGPQQRVISISLFGPKEIQRFVLPRTLFFLDSLIKDINTIYPDAFVLRIHHDSTINATNVICPIECTHPNVDFCDMKDKLYIPPKIWRFIPAGDPLVNIMMSRDLDSALTQRERAAVDVWLASNKSFHSMRDHPMHVVPMLGGMWGFRPSHSPNISRIIYGKIHDRDLVKRYGGRADQTFLTAHVWPISKSSLIVHDSFLCRNGFGYKSEPFPTQRPSANETNCFIGCVRPCCGRGTMPFGPCPEQCRPKDHPEWIYC